MELDELKQIWRQHEVPTNETENLNFNLLKEASVNKVRLLLSEFKWTYIFELVVTVWALNLLLGSILDWTDELKYFLPGLMLVLLGLYDIYWKVKVLVVYSQINYRSSITEAQKRVEKLIVYERKEINQLYLIIPVFWMAFVVVIAHGLLGIDAYQYLMYNWFWQLLASIVIAILVVWFVKLFPDKKLDEAVAFLQEIEEFKQDE